MHFNKTSITQSFDSIVLVIKRAKEIIEEHIKSGR